MDRAEYLKMCQKISVFKDGVGGIKKRHSPRTARKISRDNLLPFRV